jgi:hypothetical protein
MPNEQITLKIKVDRTTVIPGEVVTLVATPSVDLKDLKGKSITATLNAGSLTATQIRPTEWTLTTTGLALGGYPVTVALEQNGTRIPGAEATVMISVVPDLRLSIASAPSLPGTVQEGYPVDLTASVTQYDTKSKKDIEVAETKLSEGKLDITWDVGAAGRLTVDANDLGKAQLDTNNAPAGAYQITAQLVDRSGAVIVRSDGDPVEDSKALTISARPIAHQDTIPVSLKRSATAPTQDQALWVAIRNRTKAIAFSGSGYKDFIDGVLCQGTPLSSERTDKVLRRQLEELRPDIYGNAAYELLKTATEVFLLLNCGVRIDERDLSDSELFDAGMEARRLGTSLSLEDIQDRLQIYMGDNRLPYIKRVLEAAFGGQDEVDQVFCEGVLASRVANPCLLELIWCYWHEEGMLVQTLNAISLRFQNRTNAIGADPLGYMEIDPLRPLNNLLWGYVQDEHNRLTVARRAHEYDHQYGIALFGKAVPRLQSVDSRSKFIEAFHHLVHQTSLFFQQDDDTTVVADGFPVLNALKEVHLLLAEGAHNQFGDLPWTSRVEMLIQQWLLARPEMRDFLQSRAMVPYKEPWMAQVDTMKRLQGWTDVSVTHFHDLAVFGEQILLSIRYGDWIAVTDSESAKNWARYWRAEIQGYIHAYRAATGADLTFEKVDTTMPSVLLRERLGTQTSARSASRNGAPTRQSLSAAARNGALTRTMRPDTRRNQVGVEQEVD